MRKKSTPLGGAALGVLLAAGWGASADAKAVKHHHHVATSAGPSALEEKVETLSAAVSDLENRLNQEAQARQATEVEVQAAQADAAAARADAQSAHAQLAEQIQTIPGAVSQAVTAATPKAKASWSDNTKIGATVFADISNIGQTSKNNKINGTGADLKRAYVSIDHTFNDIYSANLTVDLAPNGIILNGGTFGTGTLQGSEAVKYAFVQAKYDEAFIVQIGAAKTPWIPFVEDIYGYRYIDKVVVDQNKYGNSSDWGANIHGDFEKGLFNYSVSVVDGAGYKNPSRSDTVDVEGRANINYHGFVGAIGGYYGDLADQIQGGAPNQQVSRVDALVAYTDSRIRIGAEWFQANNWKTPLGAAAVAAVNATNITGPCTIGGITEMCTIQTSPGSAAIAATPAKPDQTQGYSIFGSYNFTPKLSVFARYDSLNPSERLDPAERYEYANIGIAYEPVKTVDIALVFKHEDVSNAIKGGYGDATTVLAPGSTLTYNTSTGKYTVGSGHDYGSYNEIGIFTQFKF